MTVIDGMAVVQAMGKPPWVKTCAQWADHFIAMLDSNCSDYDEVHLMFDRYDLPTSLKEATRERRQGGKPATAYHVDNNTPVGKVSAKQFLSSTTTKDVYLAKKALHHFEGKPKIFIVTSRQNVSPTVWTYNISTAPKKKLTQGSSCTAWMLLEKEQQNYTFSHLIQMCCPRN